MSYNPGDPFENATVDISAGLSEDIYTDTASGFRGAQYLVRAYNASDEMRSLILDVVNDNGTARDSVHSRLGNGVSLSVSSVITGSDIVLRVTNTNLFSITVDVQRVLTAS